MQAAWSPNTSEEARGGEADTNALCSTSLMNRSRVPSIPEKSAVPAAKASRIPMSASVRARPSVAANENFGMES